MDLTPFYKSILEQDTASVVICNLNHDIIYMNPAACHNYEKSGGRELIGKSLFCCHPEAANTLIKKVVAWFMADYTHNKVHTFFNEKQNKDVYMIALRDGKNNLIGYYEKHEYRNRDMSPFYEMN